MSAFDGSCLARPSSSAAALIEECLRLGHVSQERLDLAQAHLRPRRPPANARIISLLDQELLVAGSGLLEQPLAHRLHLRDISQIDVGDFAEQSVGGILGQSRSSCKARVALVAGDLRCSSAISRARRARACPISTTPTDRPITVARPAPPGSSPAFGDAGPSARPGRRTGSR